MELTFADTARSFSANALEVERLLTFDRLIIDVAVGGLKHIEAALEERNLHSVLPVVQHRATMLSNIAVSGSLRPQYAAMFNQCVVLLVSYFGAAAHTLFRQGVAAALTTGADVAAAKDELKISWRAVSQAESDREVMFAGLLIAQYNISFQDMQSIYRAFEKHLGVTLERSAGLNDIIMGQAARHAIVHAGGAADSKLIRQVAGAHPRGLMPQVELGEHIRFQPSDVRLLAASMTACVGSIVDALNAALTQWQGA
ncbi:MAG: hypothetical protein H0X67_12545 [Acidobacteria bacterium]|nr:hypothetical protein [Acidobacteriota bacterium]